jgi:hypothetical protein
LAFFSDGVFFLVAHFVHPGGVEIVDFGVIVDGDLFEGVGGAEIGGASKDEVEVGGANKNHLGMAPGRFDVSGVSNDVGNASEGASFVPAFKPMGDDEHGAADFASGDKVAECLGVVI